MNKEDLKAHIEKLKKRINELETEQRTKPKISNNAELQILQRDLSEAIAKLIKNEGGGTDDR